LLGAGIGLAFAAMANLIIENVGPAETGIATGMNTVTRTVGGAFGGSAVASILAASVQETTGYPSAGGFTAAFAACALALALGVLAGLAIPPRRVEQAFATHETGDLPLPSPATSDA
jgi:MFS family permease